MENIIKNFNSLADFRKYLSQGQTQKAFESTCTHGGALEDRPGGDWYGTENFEAAENLLSDGDKQLFKKLLENGFNEAINIKGGASRPKITTSVAGFAAHVPNYLAGIPNSMLFQQRIKKPANVITIVYNLDSCGAFEDYEIITASINLLRAVVDLEKKGIRVNLYLSKMNANDRSGSQIVGITVKLKDSGQHLDPLKTAYPLCSPSMIRRHFFRFLEVTPKVSAKFVSSYGYSEKGATIETECKKVIPGGKFAVVNLSSLISASSKSWYKQGDGDPQTVIKKAVEKVYN